MGETIESLKKEIEHYKKIMALGEYDPAVKGYQAYLKIVNAQIEHVNNFSITSNIDGKKSENALYERTESMWKGLPEMIMSLNRLKLELKIEFDENEGRERRKMSTPQSMGT